MFKRRTPRALLRELLAIFILIAGAAVGIYFAFRSPPIHDVRPLGGRNVDVSRSSDAQYEVSLAADPSNARVLLAASMDDAEDVRVYESSDGGIAWRSAPAPPFERGACGLSHPAVAIGPGDLQVLASLVTTSCQSPDPLLQVATRRGPTGRWLVRDLAPPRGYAYDKRPAVAVDDRGWIYVVWPRLLGEFSSRQVLLLSRSDNGGRTWSQPARVRQYSGVYSIDLATVRNGELYLAVADGKGRSIDLLHSSDGGASWPGRRRLARLAEPYAIGCVGAVFLRAQPQYCTGPAPSVAVAGSKVDVVYSEPEANGTQAVFVVTADRALRSAEQPRRIGPADEHPADQFLPVAAYDRSTRDLWACYYDTSGDPTRKRAWFTCTVSRDNGHRWAPPVHAASNRSDETQIAADRVGYGETAGLVASTGVAHPMWTDSRRLLADREEIYTAAIPARQLRR